LKRQLAPSILLWLPFGTYIAEAFAGFGMTQFLNKYKDVSGATSLEQVRPSGHVAAQEPADILLLQ